ncbi:MAG TPA: alpha/beta hydrolase [Spirochaetota bacterium]|nr:alpha/beta hydrolase [Spirochaetota bacterium]HOS32605.1 alpha/beta hydrolase [Spirochaetota bacterium]HOS55938.1 alpha/beta hydrolase [Spirochaetota bacterium]HQF77952.1 alpha/beta hydrolase [Spirochaetota bacterium]HQH30982.1 alpha/beta hydrolase [Spirochaetota bacterium]
MALSNKIIMTSMRLLSSFFPDKPAEEIYAHAKAHNEKQVFRVPKDRRIDYEDLKIHTKIGIYHCLRMKKKGQIPKRATLYICGGGGVYDYCQPQLFLAKQLLNRVNCEIYYPFYPPSTKHPIKETYRMVFETYRLMLNEHDHTKIGVVGVSFGATAAMTMLSWNNYYNENLPMPSLTVGLSPGHAPANSAEKEMLEAYRGIDPMISVDLVEAYGRIHKGGEDLDDWLIHTAHGDFRNAGKIYLYFGEKESLAYAAPIYRNSFERAGADYKIHIEPDMPHCYGVMRINKACRKTYDEYVSRIHNL